MVAINEFLWFQDVVNHFRPMKMRKQIGKTYRVTLHTHPTPKYLEGGNASKSNTHWYQHISLIPLLMVMVSPRYSWEWFHLDGSEMMFPQNLWWIFMVSGCGKPCQTHEDEENIGKHIESHYIHIQPQNTSKVEMIPNQIPIGINTYHWFLSWWWWFLLCIVGNGPSWWVWNDVPIAFVVNIYGFRIRQTISDPWRWGKDRKNILGHITYTSNPKIPGRMRLVRLTAGDAGSCLKEPGV